MALHIEITGPLSHDEWSAVAAVAAIMLGQTALATTLPAPSRDMAAALADAGVGIDADRPENGTLVTGEPVAPPPPPVSASDALMASEAARVAPPPPLGNAVPQPVSAAPPGVDVDGTGLPHDLRIHASTKAKNANGSWRNKRGVDPALLAVVTAELRSIMAAPVPPAAVEGAGATLDPAVAFGAAPAPAAPGVAPDVVAAPPPPPAEAAPVAETGGNPEFARIMRLVVALQVAKKLSTAQSVAIATSLGLTSVKDLDKRPDLIPSFEEMLPK